MGNNPHQAAVLVQAAQGVQHRLQGLLVQGAETFIQEQGIHPGLSAGQPGQPQGQGQADQETLAAGEVFGGTDFPGLPKVDHAQVQPTLGRVAGQEITVA